jgi:acyl carrier protein
MATTETKTAGIDKNDVLQILESSLYLDVSAIEETTPLFSSGLIDSFSLATLIVEIETRAGFRMEPLDITLENLDTIERLLRFLESRA